MHCLTGARSTLARNLDATCFADLPGSAGAGSPVGIFRSPWATLALWRAHALRRFDFAVQVVIHLVSQGSRQPGFRRIRLSEWAHREGIARITAYRMLRKGILPVASERSPTGRWYVFVPDTTRRGRYVVYARAAAAPDAAETINNQLFSALRWAQEHQYPVFASVSEVADPYVSPGPKLVGLLADSSVSGIVIDHPQVVGLARLRLLSAALAPHGRSFLLVNRSTSSGPPLPDVHAALAQLCSAVLSRESSAAATADILSVLERYLIG